jgi:hypothetical protein
VATTSKSGGGGGGGGGGAEATLLVSHSRRRPRMVVEGGEKEEVLESRNSSSDDYRVLFSPEIDSIFTKMSPEYVCLELIVAEEKNTKSRRFCDLFFFTHDFTLLIFVWWVQKISVKYLKHIFQYV